ncbi:hypothetical protein GLAREA_12122 [Glarea lozoyensis ATCC 20868]|uniref:Uncharacterized protein n=1 Tax=Glarea lozoyensis (strain ATCC 20868 / MF5171) TaxID=1116229 RepID=S3D2I6_GLAL2|nr:uncharacterized protein GLAREA_12122 [Glarea lozoyensis ATCC 20868]EPE32040.1 hypothetical protein GLAREA_12122 [Glarea lozoyensis ATCC 20868]
MASSVPSELSGHFPEWVSFSVVVNSLSELDSQTSEYLQRDLLFEIEKLTTSQTERVRNLPIQVDAERAKLEDIKTYDKEKIIACHGVLPGVAGQPWEWRKGKPIEDALYELTEDLEYELEAMENDLRNMMEYELVLCSYLYHSLTTFALRAISSSSVASSIKSLIGRREGSTWPPFPAILGGIGLVNRRERIWQWMLEQVVAEHTETVRLAALQAHKTPRQSPMSTAKCLTSSETIVTLVDPRSLVSDHILDQPEPEDGGVLANGKSHASHLADFMGMEEKPSSTGLSTSSSLIDLTDFLSGAKVSEDAAATPSSLEDIMDLDPLVDEDRVKDTASDSTTSMDTGALNVGAQAISRPAVTYSSPPAYSKQLQMLHSNQDIQQPSQHAANANIVGWTPPMALTHAVVALPLYLAPVPVRPVWPTFVERLQAESSATFAKPQPGAAIIERPQAGLAARFRESQRAATNIEKPPAELSMRFKALQKENQKPLNAKASEYVSTASKSGGNDSFSWW